MRGNKPSRESKVMNWWIASRFERFYNGTLKKGPYMGWLQVQLLVWPRFKLEKFGESPGREGRSLLHLHFARGYPFILLIE